MLCVNAPAAFALRSPSGLHQVEEVEHGGLAGVEAEAGKAGLGGAGREGVVVAVEVVEEAEGLAVGGGDGGAHGVGPLCLLYGGPEGGAMPAGGIAAGEQAGGAADIGGATDGDELGGNEAAGGGPGQWAGGRHGAEEAPVGAAQGESAIAAPPHHGVSVEPLGAYAAEYDGRLPQGPAFALIGRGGGMAELAGQSLGQREAALVAPVEGHVGPEHPLGGPAVARKPHEHGLAVAQAREDAPQRLVIARQPCEHAAQWPEAGRQRAGGHPPAQGAARGGGHGLSDEAAHLPCGAGHAKRAAPADHHVAKAAVHVFVNAVEPHGDGVLGIEQQREQVGLAEAMRAPLRHCVQPAVEAVVESGVGANVG